MADLDEPAVERAMHFFCAAPPGLEEDCLPRKCVSLSLFSAMQWLCSYSVAATEVVYGRAAGAEGRDGNEETVAATVSGLCLLTLDAVAWCNCENHRKGLAVTRRLCGEE